MQQHNNSSSNATAIPVKDQVSSGVMGLCLLLGIPGNIMAVVIILRHFRKDNYTLQLILNLAVSDILCLITLPVWIYNWLSNWSLSQTVCKLMSVLAYISLCSSVLTVTLMSVQRYFMVLHAHLWNRLGRKGERALLLCLWLVVCILSIPSAVIFGVKKKGSKQTCEPAFSSDGQRAAIYLCETFLGFVVPFAVLVISYCSLHKKVSQTAFFSSKRLTKLVTSIIVTFFIFWIPFYIVNVVGVFAIFLDSSHSVTSKHLMAFYSLAKRISVSLVFMNSCVNPFLYAFAWKNLRQSPEDPEVV